MTTSDIRFRRRALKPVVALIVMACCIGGTPALAQSSQDEAWYLQLVRSVGKTLYFFAWPTDTYDHMEFGHIELKPGGADVYVVLYGNSWLEGSLWTEVVTEIRNRSVSGMHFGHYSPRAVFPPGFTLSIPDALATLNKQLQNQPGQKTSQPNPQAPAGAAISVVCITNPTQNAITYALPSENISSGTIGPGKTWMYWHNGSGVFAVSFNGLKTAELARTVHIKGSGRSGKPANCDNSMIYEFVVDGDLVGIAPRIWVPGSEDSFNPNVYRAETEGMWVCGAGYKWASPDPKETSCIPNDTGLIGATLNLNPGDLFPTIVEVRRDGPAGLAGVPAGSLLIEVNGSSVRGLSLDQVISQVRGPMNSSVRIGVQAAGSNQMRYFDLRRR